MAYTDKLRVVYGDYTLGVHGEGFDYIFSYENVVEQTHKAKIVFEKCDVDDLEILVFNSTILDTFTGKRIELPEYQQDYSESEFEVITETYNWVESKRYCYCLV